MGTDATTRYAGNYTEHTVAIGEVELYFTDWNPTAEQAILLIHGVNVQGHTWDPIAAELSKDYRVICPDLRGHGRSGWAESGYWVRLMADDLIALMNRLQILECDVVGHSLGARVAIAFAAQWQGRTKHLILSDAGPEMAMPGLQRGANKAGERAARRGFASPEEALEFYEAAHPEWQPEFRELHVIHQLKENWAGKLVERSDPELFWVTRGPGKLDSEYLWQCAERLSGPTLLLWGERSAYFNKEIVAKYRDRFGGSFSDVRCDTGHYIPRERPDDFVREVRLFLTS